MLLSTSSSIEVVRMAEMVSTTTCKFLHRKRVYDLKTLLAELELDYAATESSPNALPRLTGSFTQCSTTAANNKTMQPLIYRSSTGK